jgi:enediyne biosynthesis protein E4
MTEHKRIFYVLLITIGTLSTTFTKAQTTFSEVSLASGIDFVSPTRRMDGAGAAFFDYNNDGLMDLYLTGGDNRRDALYKNNGDGTFTDVAQEAGFSFTHSIPIYGVITGDIDNDGDRDVFLTSERNYKSYMMVNNGDGTFSNITNQAGFDDSDMDSHGATFGDFDLDGYIDIYLIGWIKDYITIDDNNGKTIGYNHNCYPNKFYKNNGDLTFTEMSVEFGLNNSGCSLASTFTDYDNDNDLDLLLANDFGMWVSPNVLWKNTYPTIGFEDVSISSGMNQEMYGMGIAIGDYDHDLDLDYYFTSIDHNFFMQNQGDGTFIDIATQLGVELDSLDKTQVITSWGAAFMDIDNDRYEDLFVANGKVTAYFRTAVEDPNALFLNDRNGGFIDISESAGIDVTDRNRTLIYADYDNDGDLDALISTIDPDSPTTKHVLLYRNDLNNGLNWLQVELEGVTVNRDAFGAKLQIFVGNDSWLKEIDGGSSYKSQHSSIAHFGLGTATKADSIEITWPGGEKEMMRNISANQRIKVIQGDIVTGIEEELILSETYKVYPNPSTRVFYLEGFLNMNYIEAINLYDAQGNNIRTADKVQIETNQTAKYKIDLVNLNDGIYFLKLTDGKFSTVKKLILRKY